MSYSIDSIQNAAIAGKFESFESMLDQTPHAIEQVIFSGYWEEISRLEAQQSQHEKEALDEFDIAFMQAHPDACIRVTYWDYPKHGEVESLFVTEAQFHRWLENERWWAYQEYCRHHSLGSLSHLNIRALYPDGRVEYV